MRGHRIGPLGEEEGKGRFGPDQVGKAGEMRSLLDVAAIR